MSNAHAVRNSAPVEVPEPIEAPVPAPSAEPAPESRPDDEHTSPTVRIRSLLPSLARAEQRVAQVVLDDASAVARRSITEVAHAAQTSETTVTRFCKAIGVSGYPALRIALAADAARATVRPAPEFDGEITAEDDTATLVGKISYADGRAIEDTAWQLDLTTLERVVDAMDKADRVDIYGVGASAFVAGDLQQKLHRIGRIGFAASDAHIMLTSAAVLASGDVAIAVTHTGATTDTVEALRTARAHGATTVAITNFPQAPISDVADYILTTAARETTFRSGETASRIAALTIVDCLFVGVAQRDMAGTVRTLNATRDALDSHRMAARHDRRRKHSANGH